MVLLVALSATCSLERGAPWELGKYLWQECVNECLSGTLSGLMGCLFSDKWPVITVFLQG